MTSGQSKHSETSDGEDGGSRNTGSAWQHFLIRKMKSGVAFLFFDSPGTQNFLTHEVLCELQQALNLIQNDNEIAALIVVSGKGNTFVAGADLHQILKFETPDDGARLSQFGNEVFSALAKLSKPTVAAINGPCIGGGLELALCCDRRLATDAPITVLGLPEVSHGLIPGLGGTQRLPRLIGAASAIEVILGGDLYSAQRASELSLVEEVVSPEELLKRAQEIAEKLIQSTGLPRKIDHDQPTPEQLKKLFALWRRSVKLKTKGRYPAKLRVLDAMEEGLKNGFDTGVALETSTFAELAVSDVARNLIFLFFTKELAKQQAFKEARSIGALASQQALAQNSGAQQALAQGAQALVTSNVPELVIIDSEIESEKNKLARVANSLEPDMVLAIITSNTPVKEIVKALTNIENIVGVQFFHPVDQIKVAELIPHEKTGRFARAVSIRHLLKSKKLPIVVRDSPGFLINRMVCAYLQQAERLAVKGIPINWIEKSMTDFGMPFGPFAVLDEIGLQNAASIMTNLHEKLGERFEMTESIYKALKAGMHGRKSGCGTYIWRDDQRVELNPDLQRELNFKMSSDQLRPDESKRLADQMILPMVDEAARCLEEKIVQRAREIDLCLVLAIGFPAFRGGLLKYADSVGIKNLVVEINEIYQQTAPTSRISDYLMKLEREKRGFYSRATD
ncbi:MAG TPA: enoyl-CoA hydratase-related protein [Drouetiella sp.]|jgi:3-hydroxyacyl-CoA dehydrogenase / enoyl-CoA hydratase / 3-hydroxybutyryl-CoA epimerase